MTELKTVRRISNSEVSDWMSCRNKYRYSFDMGLEKISHGPATPLYRGTVGHSVLEEYYANLQAQGHEFSTKMALAKMDEVIGSQRIDLESGLELRLRISEYFNEVAAYDNWEILSVEQTAEIPMLNDYLYVMKLDLAVRDSSGQIMLVDHKFTNSFWSQEELAYNIQMPKYIGALRFNGIMVDRVMINQVNWKVNKSPMTAEQKFRRLEFTPPEEQIRNALQDQIVASNEIMAYRELSEEERKRVALRTSNRMTCKMCSFKYMCGLEFQGSDIDYLILNDYSRTKTYGYNGEQEAE